MPNRIQPQKQAKPIRTKLYSAASYLDAETERHLGVQFPLDVYFQDPLVAEEDPKLAFDESFYVYWEPGLADGPTSSRFAVVDYIGDSETLVPPATWDEDQLKFTADGHVVDREAQETFQFHQVNVWGIVQRALAFYEGGFGLGRRIPWGFEGNRLLVVPHAGYGENAFYDRTSKSLQFYFFEREGERIYTCLSTDIINHECAHAILDGIRPHYLESISVQTGAFHEFLGDLTAILIALRNNEFRKTLAEETGGDLAEADHLAFIAEEFGRAVEGRDYLRSAANRMKLSDVRDDHRPHHVSQVLTGTMFEILLNFSRHYIDERDQTARQAFWNAIQRMQRTAVQPLDWLPPVDVSFKDYALAVLRAEQLTNPTDPYGYFDMMLKVFIDREILHQGDEDVAKLRGSGYVYDRQELSVFHDVDSISRSRGAAYRFLHDNRAELYIPQVADMIVADLYDANKLTRQARRLPRQIVLEYVWREEVELEGSEYGPYDGRRTTLLCGGTLVLDEHSNVLFWSRKPGTLLSLDEERQSWFGRPRVTKKEEAWRAEVKAGEERRDRFLADLARQIAAGRVGAAPETEVGLLGTRMPPLVAQSENGFVRFELAPHLSLGEDAREEDSGARQWEMSF